MEPPPESSPLLDSSSVADAPDVGLAANRRIGSVGSRYDYAELAELHNVEAPSSVVPLPATGPRKKQQQQQQQKQRQGPTLFRWAGRSRSKAESSPVNCCGCTGAEFIHDFPCVCAPCGLYFCKASCMKDRHLHLVGGRACILSPADPAAAAAVRAEVRWRLRERRPLQDDSPEPRTRLLDPLAIRALSAPKDCRSQIAAVAACIRTAVGGREGFNRVVDAVEVDRGKACCVCGHQVLILGFAYPSTGALPAAQVPRRTKKRAKARKPAPGGAATAGPPPVDKAQQQAPPQEFTVEDLDTDKLLCFVCGAWQQLWHDQQQQHQQQHQHRALPPLRSLVPKPGLALIRVSALSSLQQLLLKEALSQLTVCGQQALVQPLQRQVPRCEALADFLRRLDEEDARRRLVQRQRQPKQPAPEPDSDAEPEPGLEAPVWDADQLVAELRYFDEFSEDDAAAMAELMQQPGGLLPMELQDTPTYQQYHTVRTMPVSKASGDRSHMLRLLRAMAPSSPLLTAPDVLRRRMLASILIIGPQAFVPPGAKGAAAQAACGDPGKETPAAKRARPANGGGGTSTQGAEPKLSRGFGQPKSNATRLQLQHPYQGGVTGLHLDATMALNLAMAPAGMSPDEQRTAVLARWVFVSPAGLPQMLHLVHNLLAKQPLSAVRAKVQLCPNFEKGNRLLFTAEGVAWLKSELPPGQVLEVQQRHGDVVTAPPGWAHQVVNERVCVKLAFDHYNLSDVASNFELLHLVREVDAGLPPTAAVTATAMLLEDTPQVEQTMMDALLRMVLSEGKDAAKM